MEHDPLRVEEAAEMGSGPTQSWPPGTFPGLGWGIGPVD